MKRHIQLLIIADDEVDLAFTVNRDGASYPAMVGHKKLPLLDVSTDYLFDGKKMMSTPKMVCQSQLKCTASANGEMKKYFPQHIISRTPWL